ncbi:hypothetical protein [Sphingobium herbicidovorans]|uniref:hypothetical protein n=1 Tax=Sphingobium herbicidovorans TaxID=76947 RepID=UPI0009DA9C44|nr:hypothetical protein [Sphingobium herbicidovorans]
MPRSVIEIGVVGRDQKRHHRRKASKEGHERTMHKEGATAHRMAKGIVPLPILAVLLMGADAPTGGEAGVHAFVLTNLYLAQGGEKDSCPSMDIGDLDRFYAMLSPAEQAEYAGKEKRQALERRMNEYFKFRRLYLRGDNASSVIFPPGSTRKLNPPRHRQQPSARSTVYRKEQAVLLSRSARWSIAPAQIPMIFQCWPRASEPMRAR